MLDATSPFFSFLFFCLIASYSDIFFNSHSFSQWKQDGLRTWEITQLDAGQPFQVQALLRWDSVAAWDAASTGPHGVTVFADIPNFTTAQPVAVKGTTEAKADLTA